MPEVKEKQSVPAGLDLSQLGAAIAEGIRAGRIDPKVEQRKQIERERLREARRQELANRKMKEDACAHKRENGTSVIAWMTNSDNVTRGVCQRCNALFTPAHPRYRELIMVPTGQPII